MIDLRPLLQSLETELHHPGVPCTPDRLRALLHPDFHEVGRSGRAYDRDTVIAWLSQQAPQPQVQSTRFAVTPLGSHHALLTYRSAHRRADGSEHMATLRASVWEHTPDFAESPWRLRYHQGTPEAT